MRRRTAILAAAVASILGCGALALAPAALAANGGAAGSELSIRKIDATNPAKVDVTFMYTGKPADIQGMTLREDGQVVRSKPPVDLSKSGVTLGVVFVVDLSGSMGDDSALSQAKAGLHTLIDDLRPGDQAGVIGSGDSVTVVSDLTSDHAALGRAVDGLAAPRTGKSAMYDSIRKAATLLGEHKELQPNVVMVADGPDDASVTDVGSARADLVASGAAAFGVALGHNNEVDRPTMQSMVDRAGGLLADAPNAASIATAFSQVRSGLRSQYVVTYASHATRGQVNVELAVGSVTKTASYVSGSVAQGATSVQVRQPSKPFGPSWLRSGPAVALGLALVGLAFGLGAFAFINLAIKQEDGLTHALRPYSEDVAPEDDDNQGLAQTAFLQRAVEMTEDFAEKQGFLVKVEVLLERADLPLRAAEALFFYLAGAFFVLVAAFFLLGVMPALVVGLLAVLLPPAVLKQLASRRAKAFIGQLPDMLQLLSGSLRAGYSLMQGVEAVSQEVSEPMGKELRRVITESRLGRPVEDALDAVSERMDSKDFSWAVMAIRIQREVGGNLAELLHTVGDTMVHRDRLRRDVSALTAEGKISAIVLGLLPVGLGAIMWVINPSYMSPLISTSMGKIMLGVAVGMALIGFAWMKKTINIEI